MNIYLNDRVCRFLQKLVYNKSKNMHQGEITIPFKDYINSFKPFYPEAVHTTADGLVFHNDIRYSDAYPNSFLDIYYPSEEKKKWPVVVYYHGGGFIFGRKSFGDPLAVDGPAAEKKLTGICKEGYAVVNVDYVLATEYRFKDVFLQMDQMFRYLLDHQEELLLDMEHVALTGGSAGADCTLIYGLLVDNEDYRKEMGITPCLTHDNLKVLLPDEPALQYKQFNWAMWVMLGGLMGKLANTNPDIIDVSSKIHGSFFPTWINASNKPNDPFFKHEYDAFVKTAKEQGITCEAVYFDYDENNCSLSHGYMDLIGTNEYADKAFASFLKFLKEHI